MVARETRDAGRSSASTTERVKRKIKLKNLERSYPLAKEKFFYVLRDINEKGRDDSSARHVWDRRFFDQLTPLL